MYFLNISNIARSVHWKLPNDDERRKIYSNRSENRNLWPCNCRFSYTYILLTHSFHIAPIDELNGFLKYCKCLNNVRSEQQKKNNNNIEGCQGGNKLLFRKKRKINFIFYCLPVSERRRRLVLTISDVYNNGNDFKLTSIQQKKKKQSICRSSAA